MNSNKTATAFVDLENSRLDDQREVMQEIINQNHCPFCIENLRKYHKEPILKEGEHWLITPNQWPYDFTKVHLLAIYKKHATTLQELDPAAGKELFSMMAELEKEMKIPGGGIAMRFGDTNYSAGTVNHIHVQFLVPDIDAPDFKPVRIKVGKGNTPADMAS